MAQIYRAKEQIFPIVGEKLTIHTDTQATQSVRKKQCHLNHNGHVTLCISSSDYV